MNQNGTKTTKPLFVGVSLPREEMAALEALCELYRARQAGVGKKRRYFGSLSNVIRALIAEAAQREGIAK